jgi:hypothetical protein
MLMSSPNQSTVKYNAILYPSDIECEIAKAEYMNAYERNKEGYKNEITTNAYCIPFDAFPLIKAGVGA